MHSSRMRTACSLTVSRISIRISISVGEGGSPGERSAQGEGLPRRCLPRGMSVQGVSAQVGYAQGEGLPRASAQGRYFPGRTVCPAGFTV